MDEVERQAGEPQNPTCNREHTQYPLVPKLQNLPDFANADLGAHPSHHGHVVLGRGTPAAWVELSPTPSRWDALHRSQHTAEEGGSSREQKDAGTALCSLMADWLFYP